MCCDNKASLLYQEFKEAQKTDVVLNTYFKKLETLVNVLVQKSDCVCMVI